MVEARFYIREITRIASRGFALPAPIIQVKLAPVSGGKSEANKMWASATPSANIEMTVGNPQAAAWFEERLGQDIAVTFTDRPADEIS